MAELEVEQENIWPEGESTISYIITPRCAILNGIDKLPGPELYVITAQRKSSTVYLCVLLIYRPGRMKGLVVLGWLIIFSDKQQLRYFVS